MSMYLFPSTHLRYLQHVLEDAQRDIQNGKVPEFAENPASKASRVVVLIETQMILAPDDQPYPDDALPATLRWTVTEKVDCRHRYTKTFTESEIRYRCRWCSAQAVVDVVSESNMPALED